MCMIQTVAACQEDTTALIASFILAQSRTQYIAESVSREANSFAVLRSALFLKIKVVSVT